MKWFPTRKSLTQGTFSLTFPLRDKQKESPRQPTNLIVPNEVSLLREHGRKKNSYLLKMKTKAILIDHNNILCFKGQENLSSS